MATQNYFNIVLFTIMHKRQKQFRHVYYSFLHVSFKKCVIMISLYKLPVAQQVIKKHDPVDFDHMTMRKIISVQ